MHLFSKYTISATSVILSKYRYLFWRFILFQAQTVQASQLYRVIFWSFTENVRKQKTSFSLFDSWSLLRGLWRSGVCFFHMLLKTGQKTLLQRMIRMRHICPSLDFFIWWFVCGIELLSQQHYISGCFCLPTTSVKFPCVCVSHI